MKHCSLLAVAVSVALMRCVSTELPPEDDDSASRDDGDQRGSIRLDEISQDRETWFGEPRCEDSVILVCEDFEELSGIPRGWTPERFGAGQVEPSTDRAARGSASLRVDIEPTDVVVAMLNYGSVGALGERHWGRQFVYIEGPGTEDFAHFDLFAGRGAFEGENHEVRFAVTGAGFGASSDNFSFIYNVQTSGSGEFGTEGDRSVHPVVDEWMCLEWFFDQPEQEARFFFNGEVIESLQIDEERAEIPVFSSFLVGFQKFQATGSWTLFVDEVAFNDERIGCNN